MIYYTSARPADASDMIDQITLVYVLDQRLSYLKVEPRTLVPYDFFLRNHRPRRTKHYDRSPRDTARRLGLERMAMQPSIMPAKRPAESLANFRWVRSMPDELRDFTWIDELLIARAHVVGRVVRLQAHNQASDFGIKGHIILLPQNTTFLLDVLPMTPASSPDVVRVV